MSRTLLYEFVKVFDYLDIFNFVIHDYTSIKIPFFLFLLYW